MKKRLSLILALTMLFSILPTGIVTRAATVDSWSVYFSNCTEGTDGTVELSESNKYSGKVSLHATFNLPLLSMRYLSISQAVPVEKGKTYTYGF